MQGFIDGGNTLSIDPKPVMKSLPSASATTLGAVETKLTETLADIFNTVILPEAKKQQKSYFKESPSFEFAFSNGPCVVEGAYSSFFSENSPGWTKMKLKGSVPHAPVQPWYERLFSKKQEQPLAYQYNSIAFGFKNTVSEDHKIYIKPNHSKPEIEAHNFAIKDAWTHDSHSVLHGDNVVERFEIAKQLLNHLTAFKKDIHTDRMSCKIR